MLTPRQHILPFLVQHMLSRARHRKSAGQLGVGKRGRRPSGDFGGRRGVWATPLETSATGKALQQPFSPARSKTGCKPAPADLTFDDYRM